MNRIRQGRPVVITTGNRRSGPDRRSAARRRRARVRLQPEPGQARHQAEPAGRPDLAASSSAGVDPHFQRDAAQPGDGQGRARCRKGAGEWKAHPRVPLQRRTIDMTTRLEKFYKDEVVPKLMQQFGYTNPMEVPKSQDHHQHGRRRSLTQQERCWRTPSPTWPRSPAVKPGDQVARVGRFVQDPRRLADRRR